MAMIMRLAPFFPARILPGTAINVARTGGSATISMTWDGIQQSSVPGDLTGAEFLLRGYDGVFSRVPAGGVIPPAVTWSTLSGKPSTFPPSAHTHPISDVTLLQASLDGKVNTSDTIAANRGGTGQTSYTIGDLLYASGTSALSKLSAGTATYVLTSNGAGAAPTWQAPAATPAGSVVKSALTLYTTFTSGTTSMAGGNDTIPQITDGTEITTLSFTPTSATNTLRVTVSGPYSASAPINQWVGLFRDSTAAAKASQGLGTPAADILSNFSFQFEELAGSTSATTYRVRIGNLNGGSATWAVNGNSSARRLGGSSGLVIKIEEIKV